MQGPDQPLGVDQSQPAPAGVDLGDELAGFGEATPEGGQHRVSRDRHHRARIVPGRLGLGREPRERGLGLVHPTQLHQGDEPPEDAVAFSSEVAGCPSELDDLRGRVQPVVRAARVPQRVEARIENLGESRRVAVVQGQRGRFVSQCPAAVRGCGVPRQVLEPVARAIGLASRRSSGAAVPLRAGQRVGGPARGSLRWSRRGVPARRWDRRSPAARVPGRQAAALVRGGRPMLPPAPGAPRAAALR